SGTSVTSSAVSDGGTLTSMSFSRSGVTTMKMMRSTSTTSTSGVTLMSVFGSPCGTTVFFLAISQTSSVLDLDTQGHALGTSIAGNLQHLTDVTERQALVALEQQSLAGVRRQLRLEPGLQTRGIHRVRL